MSLKLDSISKIYPNGFLAVENFNLEVRDNEFVILVGPSGCGKSTTLRMIAGLEDITKGKLYIDGKVVNKVPPKSRGIAMVFQSYALYPHLSVYDNMAFSLDLAGFDEDEIEQRVRETAKILGLEDYLDRKPRNLSGGQRQRVALGRAIIRKAKIFLMDEPLSNLDAKQRVSMRSELVRIHRKVNATTIYVTHDQIEAMSMADRIVVMNLGHIMQVGTPKELYFHPQNIFVAGFIGDPPMNFINGRMDKHTFVSEDSSYHIDLSYLPEDKLKRLTDHQIVLGYRPEHTKISLNENDKKDDYIHLTGTIEVVEMLGDVMNIYLQKGETKAIIKTTKFASFEIDSKLDYYAQKSNLHFFDKDTEKVIDL